MQLHEGVGMGMEMMKRMDMGTDTDVASNGTQDIIMMMQMTFVCSCEATGKWGGGDFRDGCKKTPSWYSHDFRMITFF